MILRKLIREMIIEQHKEFDYDNLDADSPFIKDFYDQPEQHDKKAMLAASPPGWKVYPGTSDVYNPKHWKPVKKTNKPAVGVGGDMVPNLLIPISATAKLIVNTAISWVMNGNDLGDMDAELFDEENPVLYWGDILTHWNDLNLDFILNIDQSEFDPSIEKMYDADKLDMIRKALKQPRLVYTEPEFTSSSEDEKDY